MDTRGLTTGCLTQLHDGFHGHLEAGPSLWSVALPASGGTWAWASCVFPDARPCTLRTAPPLSQTVHTFAFRNKTYAVNTRGVRVWKPALPSGKVGSQAPAGWSLQGNVWRPKGRLSAAPGPALPGRPGLQSRLPCLQRCLPAACTVPLVRPPPCLPGVADPAPRQDVAMQESDEGAVLHHYISRSLADFEVRRGRRACAQVPQPGATAVGGPPRWCVSPAQQPRRQLHSWAVRCYGAG